ncbi:Homeobox protein Hox-B6a [Oryzias melastigma]|uniref:Homeobox protein Hox-B6a n=1 Tax=Oryzias melastigma TaxID=30732 RepID=A0A834FJZ2_ORYME|nr:Homeobox protein Hox-B6a [Oryzias melastigma]
MSSYFVNPSFPVIPGTGGGGQAAAEPFLGQISLYSSGYADHPLRHYPGAAAVSAAAAVAYSAGGGTVQDKYPGSAYYQQAANGAYGGHRAAGVGVGGAAGVGACDYASAAAAAAATFYRDKEHPCALEEHQLALSQDSMQRKAECAGLAGKGLFADTMDDKAASTPIYPWMQRMNACNGECMSSPSGLTFSFRCRPPSSSAFSCCSICLLACQSFMVLLFYCV